MFPIELRAVAGDCGRRPVEAAVNGDGLQHLQHAFLAATAMEHAEIRAVLQPHDARKGHDIAKWIVLGNASAERRQLMPCLAVVLAHDARHVAFFTAFDGFGVLLGGQGACGKDPQPLFALRIGDAIDAGAVLEVDVVRRQRAVHARPRQPRVLAASDWSRMSAVADVPDAKHRLVVRQHRRRRMRVILARFRGTACDDDLALSVPGEIDVPQRLAVLLPKRLLFRRRRFPRAVRSLGGVRDFGLGLGEDSRRQEKKEGEKCYDEVHGYLTPSSDALSAANQAVAILSMPV